jgi:hypothetical protein
VERKREPALWISTLLGVTGLALGSWWLLHWIAAAGFAAAPALWTATGLRALASCVAGGLLLLRHPWRRVALALLAAGFVAEAALAIGDGFAALLPTLAATLVALALIALAWWASA